MMGETMASSAERMAMNLGLVSEDELVAQAAEDEDTDTAAPAEDEGTQADSGTDQPVDESPETPDEDEPADEEPQEDDKADEEELSPAVKEILRKNRAEVRAANKKAAAGERYKNLVVRGAVRDAFAEAGLTEVPESMLRLIDLGKVEINDKNQLQGLDEQIVELKKDFSGLFEKRAPVGPRRRLSGEGAPRQAPVRQKSSAEILAERVTR